MHRNYAEVKVLRLGFTSSEVLESPAQDGWGCAAAAGKRQQCSAILLPMLARALTRNTHCLNQ